MRTLLTLLLSCATAYAIAQPTITSAWASPAVNSQYKNVDFNMSDIDPGASGAGVTWDFSGYDTSTTYSEKFVAPNSGYHSPQYPSATVCLAEDADVYQYFSLYGSDYKMLGSTAANGFDIVFTQPGTLVHFPCTYQTAFSDSSRYEYSDVQGDSAIAHMRVAAIADGYGTLVTQFQRFTDVIRIRAISHEVDSITSQHNIQSGTDTTYTWISAQYPGVVLASITHSVLPGGGTQQDGYFAVIGNVLGVADLSAAGIRSWTLAPQPTSGAVTVTTTNTTADKDAIYTITDLTGREIQHISAAIAPGTTTQRLDVSSLADGMYTLTLSVNNMTSTQKLVVRR